MASIRVGGFEGRYINLEVVETGTSQENNTSTIKWTLSVTGGSVDYYDVSPIKAVVNGTTVYETTSVTQWTVRAFPVGRGSRTGTITVAHKSDGTANPVAFSLSGNVYYYTPQSASGSINLTTINLYSKSQNYNTEIGSALTFEITRYNSSNYHRLTYTLGDTTTLIADNVGTTYTWNVPESIKNKITNGVSMAGSWTLTTYKSDGTKLGSNTYALVFIVPNSYKPEFSFTVSPINTNTFLRDNSLYCLGMTKALVTIGITNLYGASVTNIKVNGNLLDSGVTNYTLDAFTGSQGAKTITVDVTDTRGRTTTHNRNVIYYEYNKPAITASANRGDYVDEVFIPNPLGEYIQITWTGTCSLTAWDNGLDGDVTIRYVPNEGSSTTHTSTDLVGSDIFLSDKSKSYKITVSFADKVGYTASIVEPVGTIQVAMNINTNLRSVGIGTVATEENFLQMGFSQKFMDYNMGLLAKDGERNEYAMLYQNDSNFWIGAKSSKKATHSGGLYLSTGWDVANNKAKETIYVNVPQHYQDGTTAGTTYSVWHSGNSLDVGSLSSKNVTVSTSTWTNPYTFSLDAGIYMIIATANYNTNSSGDRVVSICDNTGESIIEGYMRQRAANGPTRMQAMCIVSPNETKNFGVLLWQNSGSNVDCNIRYRVIKIKG